MYIKKETLLKKLSTAVQLAHQHLLTATCRDPTICLPCQGNNISLYPKGQCSNTWTVLRHQMFRNIKYPTTIHPPDTYGLLINLTSRYQYTLSNAFPNGIKSIRIFGQRHPSRHQWSHHGRQNTQSRKWLNNFRKHVLLTTKHKKFFNMRTFFHHHVTLPLLEG